MFHSLICIFPWDSSVLISDPCSSVVISVCFVLFHFGLVPVQRMFHLSHCLLCFISYSFSFAFRSHFVFLPIAFPFPVSPLPIYIFISFSFSSPPHFPRISFSFIIFVWGLGDLSVCLLCWFTPGKQEGWSLARGCGVAYSGSFNEWGNLPVCM